MKLIRTEDAVGQVLCHDITQIIPGQFKGARFRKGHIVQPEDIPVLLSIGKENLYVWEKRPGILHEDEAAALLYKAAAGRNIHGTEPKEGKIELVADCDGLLKIDRAALLAVNRTPQMMIAAIHGDLPVKKGQKLAGTRIIPLVIEQEKMDAMQAAAGSEPILNVLPFHPKKFAVITTGSEVFKGRIEDKFTPILVGKLAEYGCEMTYHKTCDDDPAGITAQAEHMAEELAHLRDVVEEYGGHFCYAAVPGQYAYYPDAYPDFLNNREAYTALEVPALTHAMAERGMDLLDMGPVLDTAGNPREYYSMADYHYQFGGAYLTYRAILERLSAELGTELTILDGNSLAVETLPNPYLGSRGRKLFGLEDCGEHLTIGLPRAPVPFTRTDNGTETAPTVYALPATGTEGVLYSLYMGGDVGETVIETNRPDLPSILIYGDSFTNPVECLAYYSFDEMRSIDLRHYREMPLADYIRLHQPDIVVGIRDYEALLSTDYNGNLFQLQP